MISFRQGDLIVSNQGRVGRVIDVYRNGYVNVDFGNTPSLIHWRNLRLANDIDLAERKYG